METYPGDVNNLEESLLQRISTRSTLLFLGEEATDAPGVEKEVSSPLMMAESATKLKVGLLWLLMLTRCGFVVYGLLAFW